MKLHVDGKIITMIKKICLILVIATIQVSLKATPIRFSIKNS